MDGQWAADMLTGDVADELIATSYICGRKLRETAIVSHTDVNDAALCICEGGHFRCQGFCIAYIGKEFLYILCIDMKNVLLSLELREGITMIAASEVINVRIPAAQKAIIDTAARLEGKSRTAFILDLAVRHAEDVLAEKTHFQLSPEQWDDFTTVLDAPVRSDPSLVRLLNTPAPWDK